MASSKRGAAVVPLRQRLIDDMTMRRFSHETQRNYLRDVGRFATWLGRSPHTATAEDVRRFQIEQQETGVPAPTMNSIVAALRFFFTHTLIIATGAMFAAAAGWRQKEAGIREGAHSLIMKMMPRATGPVARAIATAVDRDRRLPPDRLTRELLTALTSTPHVLDGFLRTAARCQRVWCGGSG
jgi:hypothetical protein